MAAINVGTLNCQGQTKMSLAKQLQLQHLLRTHNYDILCCQETYIEEDSFINCEFLQNNYNIVKNNSPVCE